MRKLSKENSYQDWRKKKALYKKDYCETCGRDKKLVLHHKFYLFLGDIEASFITLCSSCHYKVHFTRKGKRIKSMLFVKERLFKLMYQAMFTPGFFANLTPREYKEYQFMCDAENT